MSGSGTVILAFVVSVVVILLAGTATPRALGKIGPIKVGA